jgi:hypothetical protein
LRNQAKTAGYLSSHSQANVGDDASGASRRRNNVCNTGRAESSQSADGNNSIRPVHTNSQDSSSFRNSPVLPVHQSHHPLLSWQKSKQFLLTAKAGRRKFFIVIEFLLYWTDMRLKSFDVGEMLLETGLLGMSRNTIKCGATAKSA